MKKYLLIFLILTACASAQRDKVRAGYGLRETRDSVLTLLLDSIASRLQIAPQISDSLDLVPRSINVTGGTGMQTLDGITAQAIDLIAGPGISITPNGADSTITFRALFGGRPVVSVMDYVWSDTSVTWRVIAQNAIDSAKGKVLVFPAGLYRLDTAGTNPYQAGTKYCLDLKTGGNTIWLMPGATLQLADSQQTDAGGPVHIVVWRDGRNIYIGGGGAIIGNTAGQPGWTGGYGQISTGCIINGYSATMDRTAANRDITIEGLTLADHWANPVNIDYGEYVTLRGIYSWGIGEGIQFSNVDYGLFEDCTLNDSSDVLVGDGFEMAGCRWSRMRGVTQLAPNTASGGIDMSYSKYCIVSGFLLDGGAYALNTQGTLGSQYNDWNRFENGTLKRMTGYAMSHIDGTVIYDNVTVDSCVHGFYFARPDAQAAASRIVIQNCTFTNMSGDIGYVRDSIDFTLSGGLIDRYDQGITVEGTGTNPGQSPILSITGTTFRNGASGITFANTGSDSAWRPRGVIRDLYFSNVPNPIAGAADDQDSIRFDYIHSQGANPARHVVRNEYLYFADHTDGGHMLMAVRHPQDSASYLSLLSRNPATGYIYMGAQGTVDAYYRLPYLEFAAGPSFLSLDRTSSRMTLGGRRVLRNEGPWGADKDSMEVTTKGYVDTRIAGLGGVIDTAALHAQKFADITDALAAWRDTSRAWRTFVTRHGDAIRIDSATAGLYVVHINPDSTAAWLADTSMTWMLNLILQKSDTAFQLRVTHPELSNLAAVSTADSNRVVCIDASTGRLKICWDDGGSGVTLAQVSATLDSGAVRPAALQTAIDTLARLGRRWTARAVLDATVTVDTTNTIYFSDRGTKGPGPSALLNFSTVPVSCYIVGIAISYVKDSAGYRMWRDTVRALAGYGADSVEAGSTLFATWWPASLGYPPSSGGLGLQKIVIAKRAYNYVPPTPSATYAWTFLSSTNTKAPLALPWDSGVNPGQRGLGEGGAMIVEIYLAEKLPGRVY